MEKIAQIPQELYQFTDEHALLIVAAKQEGRMFRAASGELELLEQFRVETPHYSDNEALPKERGEQGNTVQAKIEHEYLDHFKQAFHALAQVGHFKPTHLYLFAPKHVADELEAIIKPLFGVLPTKTIVGIFTEESPFELLQRISS